MKWLLSVVALLGVLALPARAQEMPSWFTETFLDIPEDVAEAAREGKRLVLYFHQDGCPYCKRLVEVNFQDPKIVDKMRRHFTAVQINIWGDREVTWYGSGPASRMAEKEFARLLKVQFTPTLVFFNEKGGVVLRLNGYLPPEKFHAALDGALDGAAARPVPRRSRVLDLRRGKDARPLLVLLNAPQCEACEELERQLQAEGIREHLADLELVRVGNGSRVRTNAGEVLLESNYVPAMLFFDRRGREVFRTEAYLRAFHIAGSLEYVASGAYAKEPSFQRFLHARAERLRARGEAVELWD